MKGNDAALISALTESIKDAEARLAAAEQEVRNVTAERDALVRLLSRHGDNGQQEILALAPTASTSAPQEHTQMPPTEFVLHLFDMQPNKKWRPPEIARELQRGADDGRLTTTSTNHLATVHGMMPRLVRHEKVMQGGSKRNHWFRKAQAVEEKVVQVE